MITARGKGSEGRQVEGGKGGINGDGQRRDLGG